MAVDHVRINISCGNAAFDPDPAPELARILRELAERIEQRGLDGLQAIRDINGNFVGEVSTTESDDE